MEGVDNLVSAMTSCTVHMEKMSREELETRFRLTEEVNEIEVELDSDSSESDDYQPPSKRVRPPTKTYAVEPWGRGKEKNAVGPRGRAHILKELSGKGKDIESFCISCGSSDPVIAHPLFEGSLCQKCKTNFIETLYRYDKDGYQSYCTVCCWGHQVLLCSNENCYRCFCKDCLEFLVGPGTFDRMKEVEPWSCYICDPVENNGALRLRPDWSKQVQEFFNSSSNLEFEAHRIYPALPAHQRRPVKVLSLFDGMSTDHLVLKELGLQIGQHIAAQVHDTPISAGAVHDGQTNNTRDASTITRKNVAEWGPFDLLIGGSHSQNPRGTGRLFFEYYRLLTMMRPNEDDERPFFFLFQNVVAMSEHDKHDISRFLRVNPVMVDAATVSPHYFWGNLPGMSRVNRQAPQGKSRRSAAFRHLLAPLKDHFLFQLE